MLGEISRKSIKVGRLILSAAGGAFWSCFWLLFPDVRNGIFEWMTYIVVCALMVMGAFPFSGWKESVRMLVLFYLTAFLTGGIGEVWIRKTGCHIWTLLFLAGGMICLVKAVVIPLMRGQSEKQRLYQIELVKGDIHVKMHALLDTGNRLYEPYRGRPVCVVSSGCVADLMAKKEGILYVPYKAVGTKQGMLEAMIFDEMIIDMPKGQHRIKKPMIAVCEGTVSSDGSYDLLLHPGVLDEKNKN